jgi:hypothetical protein
VYHGDTESTEKNNENQDENHRKQGDFRIEGGFMLKKWLFEKNDCSYHVIFRPLRDLRASVVDFIVVKIALSY